MLLAGRLLLLVSIPTVALASPPDLRAEGPVRAEAAHRFGAKATVLWDAARSAPSAILGLRAAVPGATPEARARGFLVANGALLGGLVDADLGPAKVTAAGDDVVVVHFQQLAQGLPVEHRNLAVRLRGAEVRAVHTDFLPVALAPQPDIGAAAAVAAVKARYGAVPTGAPVKVVLAPAPGVARVAWRVPVARIPLILMQLAYVAADDGALLQVVPAGKDGAREVMP